MNEITAELHRIAEQNGGKLLAEDVVKAAKRKDSVLHSQFCWDNTEAAHRYRLWQARQLIRVNVQIIGSNGDAEPVRTFVSLTTDRYAKEDRGGYRTIAAVLSDPDHRKQLLEDALADMEIFEKKYSVLKELIEVFSAMRKVKREAFLMDGRVEAQLAAD